ncbi:MAG TPA: type II toxin-antitoxin system RelE/ParE family toxin [Dehalococcoidia bacterium]|nr:type II toxin-antitoxin system RelE/ParE family toxin [Dehalococcoidia bacterium]
MGQFRISDSARADLINIWVYIATDSVDRADHLNSRFHEAFSTLAEFSQMGRSRPELASELRSLPVGNYVIFYRPVENGIEVIRVLHAAQDIAHLL